MNQRAYSRGAGGAAAATSLLRTPSVAFGRSANARRRGFSLSATTEEGSSLSTLDALGVIKRVVKSGRVFQKVSSRELFESLMVMNQIKGKKPENLLETLADESFNASESSSSGVEEDKLGNFWKLVYVSISLSLVQQHLSASSLSSEIMFFPDSLSSLFFFPSDYQQEECDYWHCQRARGGERRRRELLSTNSGAELERARHENPERDLRFWCCKPRLRRRL